MGMPVISPSQTTRCQAITDIIESVALEQAAISHILNAEGEKLHESVEEMIRTITQLETALQAKLELFGDCLCSCSSALGEG